MFRWLVDNLSTLALAFILAIFIWFVVAQEENPIVEQPFEAAIPVQMVNQPAGMVFTDASGVSDISLQPPERTVRVSVRGPKQTVEKLGVQDFISVVDLSAVPLHGVEVPVSVRIVDSLEKLVEIVGQDVSSVYIRMEEYQQESFTIQPYVTGAPALGHISGPAEVNPVEITLEGAAPLIDPVASARVRVSIQGAQETVRDTALVELRDTNGRQLTGFPPESLLVGVTVPITKSDEYAELFVTVDLTGTLATGYRLADFTVDPERVTLYGAPEVVSALPGFISTYAVDVSGADTDLIQRVGLRVPQGVTLIGAQTVVVEIEVEPVVTTLTFPWKPKIFGPDPGLSMTLSVESINVSMIGPLALIDLFNPETDLSLNLNLYGLEPGPHELSPTALSNVLGVEVERILPPSILVEIYELPTPTPTLTPTGTLTLTTTIPISPLATPIMTMTPSATPAGTWTPTVTPQP